MSADLYPASNHDMSVQWDTSDGRRRDSFCFAALGVVASRTGSEVDLADCDFGRTAFTAGLSVYLLLQGVGVAENVCFYAPRDAVAEQHVCVCNPFWCWTVLLCFGNIYCNRAVCR